MAWVPVHLPSAKGESPRPQSSGDGSDVSPSFATTSWIPAPHMGPLKGGSALSPPPHWFFTTGLPYLMGEFRTTSHPGNHVEQLQGACPASPILGESRLCKGQF